MQRLSFGSFFIAVSLAGIAWFTRVEFVEGLPINWPVVLAIPLRPIY
jgi:hypothetical protein